MIPVGVNIEDLKATVSTSHSVRISIYATNLDGGERVDLSSRLLGGQVDVDGAAEVTRTLSLELWDIDGSISFASDSPAQASLFLNNMIEVHYGVYLKQGRKWVDIPIFIGPVIRLVRDDDIIEVEAQGKDFFANIPAYKGDKFPEKSNRFDIIRKIMNEAGEADKNMVLPANVSKHASVFTYNTETTYWEAAQRAAQAARHRLFYDGAGRLICTDADNVVFTFKDGTGGTVLTDPAVTHNSEGVVNTVIVTGQRTVGKKKNRKTHTLSGTYIIKSSHPLSPESMGRMVNGKLVPRHLVERVEDEGLRSIAEVDAYGKKRLAEAQKMAVDVTFDAMPIPFLEPGDTVRAETDDLDLAFVIDAFSIPLIAGDSMSVGYNRRVAYGSHGEARPSKVKVIKPKKKKGGKKNNKNKGKGRRKKK